MSKPFKKMPLNAFDDEHSNVYITAAWQEHINMVTHFCQFSQNVLLIVAPEEGGKTTLLKEVLKKPLKKLRTHTVHARSEITLENLMKETIEGFDLTWVNLEAVNQQVQASIEEDYFQHEVTWALFVDDAHLLSNEQLQALLSLVKYSAQPHIHLHLVLLGEPSLELRLLSPEFTTLLQGKIFTIELESWTLQDLHTFLGNGLTRLSKEQIAFIFERSRGLPGYVMREKYAALGYSTTGKNMVQNNFKRWGTHPVALGIFVGIAMGGAYLMFNSSHSEDGSSTPINAAQSADNNWVNKDLPAPKNASNMAFHFDKVDTSDVMEEDVVPEQGKGLPVANTTQEKLAPEKTLAVNNVKEQPYLDKKAAKVVEQVAAKEEVADAAPLASEAIAKPTTKKTLASETKDPSRKSFSEQELSLLSAKSNHYTLQLLGASKQESIERFVKYHHLQDKTYSLRTKRAGKDWYIVVYGDYPSAQAAKAAVETMPNSLREMQLEPWVREMSAIQADIRLSEQG